VEIELEEPEPTGQTILMLKEDEPEVREPVGGTVLLDQEDELEFALLAEEPESSPISADFDANFDALVTSFTEESNTVLQESTVIPVSEVSPVPDQPAVDLTENINDSPELLEESIEIVMEEETGDGVSQDSINQIFDLELLIEEPTTDTPFDVDVLAKVDAPDGGLQEQPFQVSADEHITAPLVDAGDDEGAFLIDEGIDINQPEALSSQPFELVESDDPMQELIALSERLDDDFLPMFTNNGEDKGSEVDPFDVDLLSEETL
jgi:hypothetical protein